ncbi:MAG: uracil phosphoribosyltransferase [Verrucomicrobiota bacterium]
MSQVEVVEHPLVARSLTLLRDEETSVAEFRAHMRLVAKLMTPAVTEGVHTVEKSLRTPLEETKGSVLEAPVVVAPILRAGLGMAEGVAEMIPDAGIAHIGLYRDEKTLEPKVYYENYPSGLFESLVVMVDPMLATGGSAIAAADLLKTNGASDLCFLTLVACPEGIEAFHGKHPEVPIYTAAVDRGLNEKGYILPGLGDAGDRVFGTM